jgi:hypothetical protein
VAVGAGGEGVSVGPGVPAEGLGVATTVATALASTVGDATSVGVVLGSGSGVRLGDGAGVAGSGVGSGVGVGTDVGSTVEVAVGFGVAVGVTLAVGLTITDGLATAAETARRVRTGVPSTKVAVTSSSRFITMVHWLPLGLGQAVQPLNDEPPVASA